MLISLHLWENVKVGDRMIMANQQMGLRQLEAPGGTFTTPHLPIHAWCSLLALRWYPQTELTRAFFVAYLLGCVQLLVSLLRVAGLVRL